MDFVALKFSETPEITHHGEIFEGKTVIYYIRNFPYPYYMVDKRTQKMVSVYKSFIDILYNWMTETFSITLVSFKTPQVL